MKRSSIVLVAILSILVSFVFISLLAGKLYKQREYAAKYIMEDLLKYKEAQFVVYPVANYYIRKTIYSIFWMMLNNNKTVPGERIVAPFFLDPESPNNKLSQDLPPEDIKKLLNSLYIESNRRWYYFFARPFIPLNNKTSWFFQKLEYYYNDILENLKSFVENEYRKIDSTRLSIKNYNDSVEITYKYNFYMQGYINHSVDIINNYSVWPDILWYNIELSKLYCKASKILDIYKEFRNPEAFVNTLGKYKQYLYANGKNIYLKMYINYYSPIYEAYDIDPNKTFLVAALIKCSMFGGVFDGSTCELPRTKKNTYYYECTKDNNIAERTPEYVEYTYEYLYFDREDNTTIYSIYFPDTKGFSTLVDLSNIDPFLSKEAIKNVVYYNRIFYFKKVVCKVGYYKTSKIFETYSEAESFCDGYYKKDCHIYPFCARYVRYGNKTYCADYDYKVTYKQRSREVKTTDQFEIILFGCTSIE